MTSCVGIILLEGNRLTILKTLAMFLGFSDQKDGETRLERGEGNDWNAWRVTNDGRFRTKQLLLVYFG